MAGGRGKLTGEDGKKFSSEYQPNRYRQGTKWLTDGLIKILDGEKDIILEGVNIDTGEPGRFRVRVPTHEVLILSLVKQAAKGNMYALSQVWDRVEGKVSQPLEITPPDKRVRVLRPKQNDIDNGITNGDDQ